MGGWMGEWMDGVLIFWWESVWVGGGFSKRLIKTL